MDWARQDATGKISRGVPRRPAGRKIGVESWHTPFIWRDLGGIVAGFRGKGISRSLEVHHLWGIVPGFRGGAIIRRLQGHDPTCWLAQVAVSARPKRNGVMTRWRRQNFTSLPQALSRAAENTHW